MRQRRPGLASPGVWTAETTGAVSRGSPPAASRQSRSEAGLSVHGPSPPAQQPVRAEPAITSPAICSAHDAQLTVSRAQPVGGYDTRSCRIEGVAPGRIYAQECIIFHDSGQHAYVAATIAARPFT